jgi:hypothetical protein
MGIEDLKEKKEFIMSWKDMGKRVIKPLKIKSNIFLLMVLASVACLYLTKDLRIILSLILSSFVFVGFFVYYRKRIENVQKLIYQWGAADVYKHFYPEEFKEKFGNPDEENVVVHNNDRSRTKSRLSQINEIAKKYENE